jgi:hypothetical protein
MARNTPLGQASPLQHHQGSGGLVGLGNTFVRTVEGMQGLQQDLPTGGRNEVTPQDRLGDDDQLHAIHGEHPDLSLNSVTLIEAAVT